jgi:hypothetical protein
MRNAACAHLDQCGVSERASQSVQGRRGDRQLRSTAATASISTAGRIALLIGNQRYSDKVGPLRNPHSDVALVETALRNVWFEVTALRDADYRSSRPMSSSV